MVAWLVSQEAHMADDSIDWSVPLTHDDIKKTMETHSIGSPFPPINTPSSDRCLAARRADCGIISALGV